jgi:hypothetical protein
MRRCAICGHESDGATCPRDGEASWIAIPAPVPAPAEPIAAPESHENPGAPLATPKPAWRSKRR